MRNFAHQSNAMRVIFGPVTQLADEVARLGLERVLILATRRQARELAEVIDALSPKSIGIFADAAMHTPGDVTDAALAVGPEWPWINSDCSGRQTRRGQTTKVQ